MLVKGVKVFFFLIPYTKSSLHGLGRLGIGIESKQRTISPGFFCPSLTQINRQYVWNKTRTVQYSLYSLLFSQMLFRLENFEMKIFKNIWGKNTQTFFLGGSV